MRALLRWGERILFGAWSVVAWPLAFLWLLLIVLISRPITLFVPFSRFQHRFPATMVGMTPRVSFSRMRVRCHPSFDPARPCVFVQNHVSMLDGHVALFAIPRRFCGVENAAHYKVPFYGWLMREGGGIPIYPGQKGQAARLIEEARERVSRDYAILVFPEAHRTLDGKLREFRPGGFKMAQALGLPVVPVTVRGLRRVLPKGTWILRPGFIEVYIGPPVETDGLSPAELPQLMERVHDYMSHAIATGEPEPQRLELAPQAAARAAASR